MAVRNWIQRYSNNTMRLLSVLRRKFNPNTNV